MLAFRLLHIHDKIHDVKLNIKRREKQLFKPIIRIFQDADTLKELLPVISKYVAQRREANYNSLHAHIYRMVNDMIKSMNTSRLDSGDVWDYIKLNLPGAAVHGSRLSWDTSEFGIISHKKITETLQHVFGAKYSRSHGKRFLDFDLSKLYRLGKVYDLAIEVQVSKNGDSPEHERVTDVTDVTDVGHAQGLSSDVSDTESIEDEDKSSENYNKVLQNSEENTPENDSKEDAHPVHLSQVSQLAPEVEEDNTAKLREYDRLSALSFKKSREIK
jgi:hypothetical protein